MSEEQQGMEIGPNHVINSLLGQNAELTRKLALTEGALATLQEAIQNAQKQYAESQAEEGASDVVEATASEAADPKPRSRK